MVTPVMTGDGITMMTDAFTSNHTYFIRDCYPQYYGYISKLFESGYSQITVTGTPGIGKSIFYGYFAQRYRSENPKTTIVTVAVRCDSTIKACAVEKDGHFEYIAGGRIPQLEGALYLYDGAPAKELEYGRMICFTPPSERWFSLVHDSDSHCFLYMPLWTVEELRTARDVLDKPIDDRTLKDRFSIFGGVVRYCLTTNDSLYHGGTSRIVHGIRKVVSYKCLRDVLRGRGAHEHMSHELIHSVPTMTSSLPSTCYRQFASQRIQDMIDHFLRDDSGALELHRWLQRCCSAPQILEWFSKKTPVDAAPRECRNEGYILELLHKGKWGDST